MAFILSLIGHAFLLLALIAGSLDLFDSAGRRTMATLEQFLTSNTPLNLGTLDRLVRTYTDQSFIDYVYKPILDAPAALAFFICALIFWGIAALLRA